MVMSNQLTPGMILSIKDKLYRVESCVKVSIPKGTPFVKAKLRDIVTNAVVEKSFKVNQALNDVALNERKLEFLYVEGKDYLFLDVGNLEQVLISSHIIDEKVKYLREGIDVKAAFYGPTLFSVELPQFLELMVSKIEPRSGSGNGTKICHLETGAEVEVPSFIEVGDIIKVDTKNDEYIQRM
ncbi:MAG: elongation factor P [Parachlamydiaceae bacterium]|nr:elongation factor P [Parachlamydiaceae bacterium]